MTTLNKLQKLGYLTQFQVNEFTDAIQRNERQRITTLVTDAVEEIIRRNFAKKPLNVKFNITMTLVQLAKDVKNEI